ncbi:hypothetical protein Micbo1qcDRAFT_169694 [Microdochium bolleyi]|uniref:Uncharacterized protein n=1 Tax=Microdochium bolleyi TaxID=196109 RepID=A0A136IJC1_9PEZI|nr:hypothetical protein Micbo1qcDRAFT_169694 [Microdochium bolleyi]
MFSEIIYPFASPYSPSSRMYSCVVQPVQLNLCSYPSTCTSPVRSRWICICTCFRPGAFQCSTDNQ